MARRRTAKKLAIQELRTVAFYGGIQPVRAHARELLDYVLGIGELESVETVVYLAVKDDDEDYRELYAQLADAFSKLGKAEELRVKSAYQFWQS